MRCVATQLTCTESVQSDQLPRQQHRMESEYHWKSWRRDLAPTGPSNLRNEEIHSTQSGPATCISDAIFKSELTILPLHVPVFVFYGSGHGQWVFFQWCTVQQQANHKDYHTHKLLLWWWGRKKTIAKKITVLWKFRIKTYSCVKCSCWKSFAVHNNLTHVQLHITCVENISCV